MSGEFKHRGNPPHQFMRLGRLRKRIDLSNTNGDVRILAQASGLLGLLDTGCLLLRGASNITA